jgi:hypothetical protein
MRTAAHGHAAQARRGADAPCLKRMLSDQKKWRASVRAMSGSRLAKNQSCHSFAARGARYTKLYATSGVLSRNGIGSTSTVPATRAASSGERSTYVAITVPNEWPASTNGPVSPCAERIVESVAHSASRPSGGDVMRIEIGMNSSRMMPTSGSARTRSARKSQYGQSPICGAVSAQERGRG